MAQRCSCELTLALLALFGGKHAARMIKNKTTQVAGWGPEDWHLHMGEEEVHFFPLLPESVRRHLLDEHAQFRIQLRKTGKVNEEMAIEHAELEDLWAEFIAKEHGWNLHNHHEE